MASWPPSAAHAGVAKKAADGKRRCAAAADAVQACRSQPACAKAGSPAGHAQRVADEADRLMASAPPPGPIAAFAKATSGPRLTMSETEGVSMKTPPPAEAELRSSVTKARLSEQPDV